MRECFNAISANASIGISFQQMGEAGVFLLSGETYHTIINKQNYGKRGVGMATEKVDFKPIRVSEAWKKKDRYVFLIVTEE